MSEKILLIRCQHCNAVNAAWLCERDAMRDIGRSVLAAAARGAKLEFIDRSTDGVKVHDCDCLARLTPGEGEA